MPRIEKQFRTRPASNLPRVSKPVAVFCVLLAALFWAGCASQRGFSKTFPARLTEAQNFWRFQDRPLAAQPAIPAFSSSQEDFSAMLDRLVYFSPLRGHKIQLMVMNDAKINAHTDGRAVYVSSGLLAAFNQHPNLMASVLAHEVGHILANHQAQRSRGSAWHYLSYVTPALGMLPYGSLYGGVAGTVVREGDQIRQYSYDRLQENEADAIGVYLASEAGYDAMGLSEFLDYAGSPAFGKPKTLSIPTSVASIPQSVAVTLLSTSPLYKTHPPSAKRKRAIRLMLQRKREEITPEQLRREARWMADLYEVLQRRFPKA